MQIEQLRKIIEAGIDDAKVVVQGDGRHFEAIVIGDVFANKSKLQQQQLVYQVLNDYIASGELHAISLQTYTPQQWQTLTSQQ